MPVEVRVSVSDLANSTTLSLSRKVTDGPITIALMGANGQQLTATVDAVEFFHGIRALYPELTIQ